METAISQLVDQYDQGRLTRRELVASLALFVGMGARVAQAQDADESTFTATGLNHIALNVTDVERSRDFYVRHLGLPVRSDSSPHNCFLGCGPNFVALFRGREAGLNHYCYSIAGFATGAVTERLRAVGLAPEVRGQRVYFPDPDGITVQLASEAHGV